MPRNASLGNASLATEAPKDAFWVFGYGSLMWKPGFEYTSCRQARLYGYRRALCVLSYIYRGSPDYPGLVFGLVTGGSCVGRAFRVAKPRCVATYDYLMQREMIRGVYKPCWLPVRTPAGRVSALCFIADPGHEQYVWGMSEAELVSRIRRARGKGGTNIEYIVNTCHQLRDLGIDAPELARIRDAVAPERRR
jgi:cation transport protein ChaC